MVVLRYNVRKNPLSKNSVQSVRNQGFMHERTVYQGFAHSRTHTALETYTLSGFVSGQDSHDATVPHLLTGFLCEIADYHEGLDLCNF